MAINETINYYDAKNKHRSKRKVEVELPTLCTLTRLKKNKESSDPYAQLLHSNASSFNQGHITNQNDYRKKTNKTDLAADQIKSRNSHYTVKESSSQNFKFENITGHFLLENKRKDLNKSKRHSLHNNSYYRELLEKYQTLNSKHQKKVVVDKNNQGLIGDFESQLHNRPQLHTAQNLGTDFLANKKTEDQIENYKITSKPQYILKIESIDHMISDDLATELKPHISKKEINLSKNKTIRIDTEQTPSKDAKNINEKLKRDTMKLFENKIMNNLKANEAKDKDQYSDKKELRPITDNKSVLSPKIFPSKNFSNLLKKLKKKKEISAKDLPQPTIPLVIDIKASNINDLLIQKNDKLKLSLNSIEQPESSVIRVLDSAKSVLKQDVKPRRFRLFCCF